MADIKLRDNTGTERTYTGIDTITLPLADGSGLHKFGFGDEDFEIKTSDIPTINDSVLHRGGLLNSFILSNLNRIKFPISKDDDDVLYINLPILYHEYSYSSGDREVDFSDIVLDKEKPEYIRFNYNGLIQGGYRLTGLPTILNDDLGIDTEGSNPLLTSFNVANMSMYTEFLSHFSYYAHGRYRTSLLPMQLCYIGALDTDSNFSVATIVNDILNNDKTVYDVIYDHYLSYELPYSVYTRYSKILMPVAKNFRNASVTLSFGAEDTSMFLDTLKFCKDGENPYIV